MADSSVSSLLEGKPTETPTPVVAENQSPLESGAYQPVAKEAVPAQETAVPAPVTPPEKSAFSAVKDAKSTEGAPKQATAPSASMTSRLPIMVFILVSILVVIFVAVWLVTSNGMFSFLSSQSPSERGNQVPNGVAVGLLEGDLDPNSTQQLMDSLISQAAFYRLDTINTPEGTVLYQYDEEADATTIYVRLSDIKQRYAFWTVMENNGEVAYLEPEVSDVEGNASYIVVNVPDEESVFSRFIITEEETELPIIPSDTVIYELETIRE